MIPTYGTPGCAHPEKRKFGNGLAWCQCCGAVFDGFAWDTPKGQADARVSNLEFQNKNLRAQLDALECQVAELEGELEALHDDVSQHAVEKDLSA